MKKTAEHETSKSTPGYSGREMHAPKPGDSRYIVRRVSDGRFLQHPDGRGWVVRDKGFNPKTSVLTLQLVKTAPALPTKEAPDFTEADKDWIAKIDRTQLSWDEW